MLGEGLVDRLLELFPGVGGDPLNGPIAGRRIGDAEAEGLAAERARDEVGSTVEA